MVNEKQTKRERNIKSKLMAAIAMLLVSSIMMVSTTYAWFTLSTAPEVTGITTSVGANGNLEMALVPTGGIATIAPSATGDSTKSLNDKNITWGNLVDLNYAIDNVNYYGLDKITLNPSKLNLTEAGKIAEAMLQTPSYGSDGRLDTLLSNTVASIFNTTSKTFAQETGYGVRAVGVASGMTDRQLSYRNARSAANTAMSMATTVASESLNINGASLANIAVSHAANGGTESYTAADIDKLEAIVNDLLGVKDQDGKTVKTGVIEYIENAYLNYIIAFGASKAAYTADLDDNEYKVFEAAVTGAADVYAAAALCESKGVTLPAAITEPLAKLALTKKNVTDARTGLAGITKTEGIAWSEFSTYLTLLADMDAMQINGYAASTFRANMSNIINKIASEGLTVSIATGGGVYADVADHCGDFTAAIVINEVSYNGMTLNNMNARMKTATTVSPVYLSVVSTQVERAAAPESAGGQTMPISDFYGYVIDLAFRTNADDSNLLLQTEAIDRIYGDNAEGAQTQGHGASMTFTSTTTDFTVDQLKSLMGAIRVVFFDPTAENKVLGTAKLDLSENAYTVTGGNTITAKLYLYKTIAAGTTTTYEPIGENETGNYISDGNGGYREITGDEVGTHKQVVTNTAASEQKLTGDDAVITALKQNEAVGVSALVYLDGELVTNASVAATAATSMTGTMNLQFSSSANLIPMEYGDLHITDATVPATTTPANP